MPANYTFAPHTTHKMLPGVLDRNDTTRKRKADVALGSPAGSPLKHLGRTVDSSNAGYLRGKGVDEYDLDGLCIFDSLGISGLTIRHDDSGEAHLVISRGAVSSPLKLTHRHIIWVFHSVNPVVALPWQEGPFTDVTPGTAGVGDNAFLFITDGDVDWLAEGVIDALLDGFEENGCGLDGLDLPLPVITGTDDETPTTVSADNTAASPMYCDFYEIWPCLDVDIDLGQDLPYDQI